MIVYALELVWIHVKLHEEGTNFFLFVIPNSFSVFVAFILIIISIIILFVLINRGLIFAFTPNDVLVVGLNLIHKFLFSEANDVERTNFVGVNIFAAIIIFILIILSDLYHN